MGDRLDNLERGNQQENHQRKVYTQKDFTNHLRSRMEGEFGEQNRALKYYEINFPDKIREIKTDFFRFVPVESNFEKAWRRAAHSLAQDRYMNKAKRASSSQNKENELESRSQC